MQKLLAVAALLLLSVGCATEGAGEPAPADLRATLAHAADRHRVCDAVVAVVKERRLETVETVGGCESVRPPRADAVFQAASLGKPVFAYAVLKLVEQGRLSLDTPVVAYLPGGYRRRLHPFGPPSDTAVEQLSDARIASVTVRMALNHTSGLPNWSSGPLGFVADPGARWSYSGEGYLLLQRAVEAVTGSSLDRYMAEQVLKPLGMANSSFVWEDRFRADLVAATGTDGVPARPWRFRSPVAAATLYTTARDYGAFLATVLGDPPILALVMESEVQVDPRLNLGWGNGWGIERTNSATYLWQWGNNPGYRNFVMADPRTGNGFVLLTNSDNGLALAEPVASAVLPDTHRVFRFRMLHDGLASVLCDTLDACTF